jgi:hypothetical protein
MLSLIRPAGDQGVPWPGLLLGIAVLGLYYWCTNQYMVQQTLAARAMSVAVWSTDRRRLLGDAVTDCFEAVGSGVT